MNWLKNLIISKSWKFKMIRYVIFWVCQWVLKTLSRIFGWGFISRHGKYRWSRSLESHPSCFGHFVLMCNLLTFFFHTDNTSFILVFFNKFQQENYVGMWGHYGSKIMRVFSQPLNDALGSTTNILWWYRPSLYGGLCLVYFFKELGSSGSLFVL